MAQANDSIAVTPGAGATIATHNPGDGKEYQVVMLANSLGHLEDTNPSYSWWIPTAAVASNKLFGDIFNAAGSGKKIKIRGVWCIVDSDTAVAGALGIQVMLNRTSAVGTGGTVATYNTGTVETTGTIVPFDTENAALPAQITARAVPGGGATISAFLWSQFYAGEETATSTSYLTSFQNMMPISSRLQDITLNEGQGLLIKQGPVAATGNVSFQICFTVE